MAKKKKEEKGKKARKKAPETNGAAAATIVEMADGGISERVSEPAPQSDEQERILDAWIGTGVKLRHPVNMSSAFAVGSTTGQLEATDDRGVLLRLKRDQFQFHPWSCIYAIMPDEKGKLSEE